MKEARHKILHIAWLHLRKMSRTGTSIETPDCEQGAPTRGHVIFLGMTDLFCN